jgi:single-stranded DNA-binding protein
MSKNTVELQGVVKWEPKIFPPMQDGQKPIMVFALEYAGKNDRKSVFHFKAYGDLVETLDTERLSQGDTILVSGMLNEAKWIDKTTEKWVNRIEVWANKVEFVERIAGVDTSDFVAAGAGDMDDIPF